MSYITAPFRFLRFAFKTVTATIITLAFVSSLMLNIVMVTWTQGALAIGGALNALTGISSVATNLNQKNNGLVKQAATQKRAVGAITNRLAKRTRRGAIRNIVAVPAEALPVAGALVVVGVTGLELKDACQTMNDLAELNTLMEQDRHADNGTVCGLKLPTVKEVKERTSTSPGAVWDAIRQWRVDVPPWDEIEQKTNSGR